MENKIQSMEKRIEVIEKDIKDTNKKVAEIDKGVAGSGIQIGQIFKMLEEIKASTSTISKEVGNLKGKPARKWESVEMIGLTVIVTSVINFIIGRLL